MWKEISKEMMKKNLDVSAIQVENKFKSMERAYKNMLSNNT